MAAFVGLFVSAGTSTRSILREVHVAKSILNGKVGWGAGNSNSSTPWARMSWIRFSVCTALNAYSRGSGSRSTPPCIHARDRVVDFGKNQGSMLGTLSSRYLRWMTKNLKGTILNEWAGYAQEVLDDPLHRDRFEWEKVEKLLVQSHDLAQLSHSGDALAPARMYGWDLDNESD